MAHVASDFISDGFIFLGTSSSLAFFPVPSPTLDTDWSGLTNAPRETEKCRFRCQSTVYASKTAPGRHERSKQLASPLNVRLRLYCPPPFSWESHQKNTFPGNTDIGPISPAAAAEKPLPPTLHPIAPTLMNIVKMASKSRGRLLFPARIRLLNLELWDLWAGAGSLCCGLCTVTWTNSLISLSLSLSALSPGLKLSCAWTGLQALDKNDENKQPWVLWGSFYTNYRGRALF